MIVNFVGNYKQGYVGEEADEVHLTREMEKLGHEVNRVPRDVWKAYCDGHEPNGDWQLPKEADINIICKWHHFNTGMYVDGLREMSGGAPAFYWVWDYMNEFDPENWNFQMAKASDLYLTGEGGLVGKYRQVGIPAYYFQMDVADADLPVFEYEDKIYDVSFFGSFMGKGNRVEYLRYLQQLMPIHIWAWNHQDWEKNGFKYVHQAVYGKDFTRTVGQTKVVLGFSVEPNCWGYWSNRIGKVFLAGGCLLYEYAPGMERLVGPGVEFFSSTEEMLGKVVHLRDHDEARIRLSAQARINGLDNFSSNARVEQLMNLVERFIKCKNGGRQWLV